MNEHPEAAGPGGAAPFSGPGQLEVLTGGDALDRVADDWDRLWLATDPPAPMLEGVWVRRWWRQHGAGLEPLVAVLRDEAGRAQAIAPLYRRRAFDRESLGLRTVQILGMGEREADEVFGEYHSWLGPPAARDALSAALARWLAADPGWDRLRLQNLSLEAAIPARLVEPLGVPRAFADIRRFPSFRSPALAIDAYLAAVKSPKVRHKIRRSLKEVSARGIAFQRAGSLAEARAMLDELARLHQRQWEARGRRGVFASGVFRAFHDDLLAHYAQHGRLWLVGLRQGQNLIAARYLIEARGWLFDYISGLGATDDNLLNPGLALHMLTIDCAAAAGVKIYDFMGGDYDYKRRMALVEAEQDAVDLIRGNLRGRAWVSARAARRWLQQRRRRWSGRNAATAEASKTDPPKGDPDKANDAPGRLDNPDLLG